MIYGIEQTSDLRDRQTKIKTFTSSKKGFEKAKVWASGGVNLAFFDPKNQHRRFRELWNLSTKPKWKAAYKEYQKECRGSSVYRRYPEDFEAGAIRDVGTQIDTSVTFWYL